MQKQIHNCESISYVYCTIVNLFHRNTFTIVNLFHMSYEITIVNVYAIESHVHMIHLGDGGIRLHFALNIYTDIDINKNEHRHTINTYDSP